MANDKKILLLSGLGTLDDHLVAAAVALRRWPGAELQFVSMGVLPEELLKRAGGGFGEIHLLGIGLEADPAALEKAFRAVRDGGASLVWHSAGYDVPPRIPDSARGLFEARVGPAGRLAAWLAADLGVSAGPLLALLDEKADTEPIRRWRERFHAAAWNFSNSHDWSTLGQTVRDLALAVPPPRWEPAVGTLVGYWKSFGYRELQASGPKMRKVRKDIGRIAKSGVRRVLVTGESGVGKETVAQQLHVQSGRRGPYFAFNCATVASNLIESRLFGYRKGAFTGADKDTPGLFRRADGGTLFLDEIAELPIGVQGVLLRALQDGVVQPVGAEDEERVDVLVVAATNRDLREMVRARQFREDLFWRLSVAEIRMPPLRERTVDLPATAKRIWARIAPKKRPLSKEDLAAIEAYAWPGNVRQLSNVLERAAYFDDRAIPELIAEESAEAARMAEPPAAPAASDEKKGGGQMKMEI